MKKLLIRFCWRIALPFLCDDMQKCWTFRILEILEHGHEIIDIMPINRTKIIETQSFKKHARCEQRFESIINLMCNFSNAISGCIYFSGNVPNMRAQFCSGWRRENLGEIIAEGPNIWSNRHIIIIQYHKQITILHTAIVHCFIDHSTGHGTITNHGNNAIIIIREIASSG